MRKLASIKLVDEIRPIEKADRLELAIVGGWQVVVLKDSVKAGEKIVYFEIDSLLPADERWQFLEANKWRVKTIRLRGQISQGLVQNISVFDELEGLELNVGDDVTELLGVKKYVSPIEVGSIGNYAPIPEHISKTGEERVQNMINVLEKDNLVYVSEKIDGTSTTFFKENDEYYICSHTQIVVKLNRKGFYEFAIDNADYKERTLRILKAIERQEKVYERLTELEDIKKIFEDTIKSIKVGIQREIEKEINFNDNLESNEKNYVTAKKVGGVYFEMFEKYNIKKILDENPDLIIQGESVGPSGSGSTKNYYKIDENKLFVFNIKNKNDGELFELSEMENLAKKYNLDIVPIVERNIPLREYASGNLEELLNKTNAKSKLNPEIDIEGYVIRSMNPKDGITFKVISNNFLLKEK